MEAHFDAYAQTYEQALNAGLKVSGEDRDYFVAHRLSAARSAVERLVPRCGRNKAIDFGCGTGHTAKSLQEKFGFASLLGLDVSTESLAVADARYSNSSLQFDTIDNYSPDTDVDLVYCNGVFHHIAANCRSDSVGYIHASLKSGGVFVFWENNPWNPGVHYIMRAIPFDRDAHLIFPSTALKLLRESGFKILQLRFFFVFPKALAAFRCLESGLSLLPLGAQYQIIAVK